MMSSVEEVSVIRIAPLEANSRIWHVCWNHNGTVLASCGEDKTIRIWKKTDASPYLECRTTINDAHNRAVRCVAFSHCGKYLASAAFDATIVIYQQENGDFEEVNKLEGHESEVKCCAFSPSDEFLATCSRDKSVWFWQLDEDEDFQVSSVLQPHTQDVKSVVWHPNEDLLVSCSYDSSIRFFKYDGEDWITQQKIDQAHEGTVWASAFNGDGTLLVTVGEDRVVQLWKRDPLTEPAIRSQWRSVAKYTVDGCRWPLYTLSWNTTNGLIAVGAGDKTIRLFSVEKSDGLEVLIPQKEILNHEGDVNCVAWNPVDSELLASSSDDGTIRLFRVQL